MLYKDVNNTFVIMGETDNYIYTTLGTQSMLILSYRHVHIQIRHSKEIQLEA